MEKSLQPEDVAIKRLNSAISEYRRLCLKNHLLYTTCKSLAIILAAMIPLIGVFEPTTTILLPLMPVKVTPIQLAAILGAMSAIVHSFESFFQFHRQWIHTSLTEDALTREKYLYLTQVEPYEQSHHRYKALARRVETILEKANCQWASRDANPSAASAERPTVLTPKITSAVITSETQSLNDAEGPFAQSATTTAVTSVDLQTAAR